MVLSTWLVLAGICLIYVALEFWAVAQIFPTNRVVTPPTSHYRQQEETET